MKVCSICQRCYTNSVETCHHDGCDEFVNAGTGDPEMITGYTLTRRVNASRYADTYEAHENTSGASCVIKLYSPSADSDVILREANAVKSIFHSGIIGVYDTGTTDDGRVFVVTEDAKGQSLRQLLTNVGPPDLLASIEIVKQVAEALHALHENNITHGAIRPENISLTSGADGHALVRIDNADYGRVIERAITSNKFEIDSHIDELRYFSPEQCTSVGTTPRSDVYSLGVVFFELLAGSPPFNSTKAVDLIEKHLHERPAEIKIDNFDLRMLVTHALSESLQKQPGSRQTSAGLLARQLRHIEQLATHSSTPPPAVKTAARELKKTVAIPRVEIYEVAPEKLEPRDTVAAVGEVTRNSVQQTAVTEPVEASERHETTAAAPKRSRLRTLKRKLHAMVASTMERDTITSIASEQPVAKTPRKIEWIQPEDDIPSVEEVVKAAESVEEPVVVPAVTSVAEEVMPAILHVEVETPAERKAEIAPAVIPQKLVSPETKITPAVASAKPSAPAARTRTALPDTATVISPKLGILKPARVLETSKREVKKRTITTPIISPKLGLLIPVVARGAEVSVADASVRKPVSKPPMTSPQYDSDEEITLVRSPKSRVTIDLEKPRTIYPPQNAFGRSADDIAFQPTLIGTRKQKRSRAVIAEPQDGMFSAHIAASPTGGNLTYRVMMIGAGCVVLAMLVLFANDSFSRLFQSVSPGDSATAQATSSEVASEADPVVVPPSKPIAAPRKASSSPVAEAKPEKRVTESKPKPETKPAREKVSPTEKPKPAKIVETRKPAISQVPKPQPRRTETAGPTGATRPRIVRDPRP